MRIGKLYRLKKKSYKSHGNSLQAYGLNSNMIFRYPIESCFMLLGVKNKTRTGFYIDPPRCIIEMLLPDGKQGSLNIDPSDFEEADGKEL